MSFSSDKCLNRGLLDGLGGRARHHYTRNPFDLMVQLQMMHLINKSLQHMASFNVRLECAPLPIGLACVASREIQGSRRTNSRSTRMTHVTTIHTAIISQEYLDPQGDAICFTSITLVSHKLLIRLYRAASQGEWIHILCSTTWLGSRLVVAQRCPSHSLDITRECRRPIFGPRSKGF